MKQDDLEHICHMIGSLSGIPVRVFRGEELLFYHSVAAFPRDPMLLHRAEIWGVSDHVGYTVTEQFYTYGVLNAESIRFVIGPTRQLPCERGAPRPPRSAAGSLRQTSFGS